MKNKPQKVIALFIVIIALVIYSVPFTSSSHNEEGKKNYCRYRLAVYEFYFIEAEGEGYGESDTLVGDIILVKKVGGVLEYFGLKKINIE